MRVWSRLRLPWTKCCQTNAANCIYGVSGITFSYCISIEIAYTNILLKGVMIFSQQNLETALESLLSETEVS